MKKRIKTSLIILAESNFVFCSTRRVHLFVSIQTWKIVVNWEKARKAGVHLYELFNYAGYFIFFVDILLLYYLRLSIRRDEPVFVNPYSECGVVNPCCVSYLLFNLILSELVGCYVNNHEEERIYINTRLMSSGFVYHWSITRKSRIISSTPGFFELMSNGATPFIIALNRTSIQLSMCQARRHL